MASQENQVWEFSYTGTIQSISLPSGFYKLEVWGAQGGDDTWGSSRYKDGGLGGYSYGTILLNFDFENLVYVVCGGKGRNTSGGVINGNGYNGGGYSSGSHGSGGGGATHIALVPGLLSTLSSQRNQILIVAGGGGGFDYGGSHKRAAGGGGGGLQLPDTAYGNNKIATSTSGYSFGLGQPIGDNFQSGAGGGGFYGGYIGIDEDQGKGGGSSGGGGSAYLSPLLYDVGGQSGINYGKGGAKITLLSRVFLDRVNSNFYKNANEQNVIDFKILLGE